MDASLTFDEPGRTSLARCFVWCVMPMLESSSPQNAQVLLNCLRILAPRCDLRHLQSLVYFRLGQYGEALQILGGLDNPESKAFHILCERAMGEPSWWGGARILWESGDVAARTVLAPWVEHLFETASVATAGSLAEPSAEPFFNAPNAFSDGEAASAPEYPAMADRKTPLDLTLKSLRA